MVKISFYPIMEEEAMQRFHLGLEENNVIHNVTAGAYRFQK